jgi:ferredoxin--NADP+ reductase
LAPSVYLFRIDAPKVARKAKAGQFVIVRVCQEGERIPLTIADWDEEEGSVTIVFMAVGTSTYRLAGLKTGDSICDFVGPLGVPSEIDKFGTVVCVCGGYAVAPIFPIARALKKVGNRVISIQGARTKDLLFWTDKVAKFSDQMIVTTDDGSYDRKGLVTEPLKEILEAQQVDRVIAIGPSVMMKFCAKTSQPFGVKTVVSLNPIMVDGTGMCGCCRVLIGDETKFACVDGPEFDGHKVDWDLLMVRQKTYLEEEEHSLRKWREKHAADCRGVSANGEK